MVIHSVQKQRKNTSDISKYHSKRASMGNPPMGTLPSAKRSEVVNSGVFGAWDVLRGLDGDFGRDGLALVVYGDKLPLFEGVRGARAVIGPVASGA